MTPSTSHSAAGTSFPCETSQPMSSQSSSQLPHIYMLTKHLNGSLNLWKVGIVTHCMTIRNMAAILTSFLIGFQANFAENSKYRTCVSLSHSSRACGHRFRTNSAASHPVLPLLITTSHHNLQSKDNTLHAVSGPIKPYFSLGFQSIRELLGRDQSAYCTSIGYYPDRMIYPEWMPTVIGASDYRGRGGTRICHTEC